MKNYLFIILFFQVSCTTFYESKPKKNFDGKYFRNSTVQKMSFWDLSKLAFGGPNHDWPESVKIVPKKEFPERVFTDIKYTFIGHSTMLIQTAGLNILTDPVYSERVSPVSFAGPKRARIPAVRFDDLPHIDVVLISHDHYDHLDLETLANLMKKQPQKPPIIVAGLGNDVLFEDENIKPFVSLNWEESFKVKDTKFTFVECQHRSGRSMFGHNRTLWGSFVIETPKATIYFAGDTAYSNHFKRQGQKYKKFDLSFLPIGAYKPRWFMNRVHVDPEQSVQAHQDLFSKHSVGIHFGTFKLTYEKIDDPIKDLNEALKRAKLPHHEFIVPKFGKTVEVKPAI